MNKVIMFFALISISYYNDVGYKTQSKQKVLVDTTVNGKLKLENATSLKLFDADYKELFRYENIRESPVYAFVNANKTEYLLAYKYEGDSKNAFACFEIGYLSDLNIKKYKHLNYAHFKTESGLSLGMRKKDILSRKGVLFNLDFKRDTTLLYRCEDSNSKFLKRYRMPSYFIQLTLKESKVEKIKFGFDYP